MKENTIKDMDVYSKDSTVVERPESYNIGVKVGWTAPAKWWNWLFKNVTERLKDIFVTTTSIHNEIKNAVGGTLDPESDTQLKDKLEQMKKDLEDMTAQVSANLAALEATKAKPNGIASLDPDGRIPYSQLPESAMEFKGDWNASTNTPTLADGTGDLGDMYLVSVGGTVDLGSGNITFLDGDRVIYNQAGKWEKISGGSVKSVNNNMPDDTGNVNVVVDSSHIVAGAVTSAKIANGAVTSAKIENGAVTSAKIENGAITASKCRDKSNIYMHNMYIFCKSPNINVGIRLIVAVFTKTASYYKTNVIQFIDDLVEIYGKGGHTPATGINFLHTDVKYNVVGIAGVSYASGTRRLLVYSEYSNNDLNSDAFDITELNTGKIEIISESVVNIIAM